jgi:hypothetical protein
MICKYTIPTEEGKPPRNSELYLKIKEVYGQSNQDMADKIYETVMSDAFKSQFGNFSMFYFYDIIKKQELKDSYTKKEALSEQLRINKTYGEGSALAVEKDGNWTLDFIKPEVGTLSVATDDNGEPLLFFHHNAMNSFTTDINVAGNYGTPDDYIGSMPQPIKGKLLPVFLNIKDIDEGIISEYVNEKGKTIREATVFHDDTVISAHRGVGSYIPAPGTTGMSTPVSDPAKPTPEEEVANIEQRRKFASDAIVKLRRKLELLQRTSPKGKRTVALRKKINELKLLQKANKNTEIIIEFIKFAEKEVSFSKQLIKHIESEIKLAETLDEKRKVLKRLHKGSSYTSVFKTIIDGFNAIEGSTFVDEEGVNKIIDDEFYQKYVNSIRGDIDTIQRKYIENAKPIMTEFLYGYNTDPELTKNDILRMLTSVNDDVSWFRANVGALASSPDQILGMVDRIIKKERNQINYDMVTFNNTELKNAIDALKESQPNVSDKNHEKFYNFMLERDENKELTGKYIEKGSERYNKLNAGQKQFFDLFHKNYTKHQRMLPISFRRGYQLIPILKSGSERAWEQRSLKAGKKYISDSITRTSNDTDFVEVTTDEEGKEYRFVPIKYAGSISKDGDNSIRPSDVSLDMASSLHRFMTMSKNHVAMVNVINEIETIKDLIGEREFTVKVGGLKKIVKGERDFLKREGKYSRAFKQLEEYLNMHVYGEMKQDEGTFGSTNIDRAKIADLLGKYTSVRSLAANVFSGINNVSVAQAMNMIEAGGGQFFDRKHLRQAKVQYSKNFYGFVKDSVSEYQTNEIGVWMDSWDIFQDFNEYGVPRKSKSLAARIAGKLTFISQSSGEHMVQTEVALACANSHRVVDGKIMSYQDWLIANPDKPNTKAVKKEFESTYPSVKDIITLKDGASVTTVELNEGEMSKFAERIKGVYQYLHGNYSRGDKSALQKFALGRMVMTFRRWLEPGFQRRWANDTFDDREAFDQRLGAKTAGYYVITYKFLKKWFGNIKKEGMSVAMLKEEWSNLPEWRKSAIKRTMMEGLLAAATMTLLVLLGSLDGDDEDDWIKSMAIYQLHRLDSEISFYRNLGSAMEILRSPSATMSTIEAMGDAFGLATGPMLNFGDNWLEYETYERGKHKGKSKVGVAAKKLIPFSYQIERMMTPYDTAKYLESL